MVALPNEAAMISRGLVVIVALLTGALLKYKKVTPYLRLQPNAQRRAAED
jgi:hypothetical protein